MYIEIIVQFSLEVTQDHLILHNIAIHVEKSRKMEVSYCNAKGAMKLSYKIISNIKVRVRILDYR